MAVSIQRRERGRAGSGGFLPGLLAGGVSSFLGDLLFAGATAAWGLAMPLLGGLAFSLVTGLVTLFGLSGGLSAEPPGEPETKHVTLPSGLLPQPVEEEPPFIPTSLTCTDSRGRSGSFTAVLFSRAYSWTLAAEDSTELNGSERNFLEILRSTALADHLQNAPEVVAVGTASCEGYPEHTEREIERGRARARQLQAWLEAVREPRLGESHLDPVLALNLGVYARPCTGGDTWEQRRVLLFAVYREAEGPDLLECLSRALEDDPELRYLATDYEPGFGPGTELF